MVRRLRSAHALAIALLAGAAVLASSCTESKDDLLVKGSLGLFRKDTDKAIQAFTAVLKMDAADPDAHRGMANAHGLQDDGLAKREEWLVKGHSLPKLSDQDRRYFGDQLEKHYLKMAAAAKDGDDAAYEAALKAAVKLKDRSKAAGQLARFYIDSAKGLAGEGKLIEAATMLFMKFFCRATSPFWNTEYTNCSGSARELIAITMATW